MSPTARPVALVSRTVVAPAAAAAPVVVACVAQVAIGAFVSIWTGMVR